MAICFFQWLLFLPGWQQALCSPRPPLMQFPVPSVGKHPHPRACAQHMTARTRGQWRWKPSSYSLTSKGPGRAASAQSRHLFLIHLKVSQGPARSPSPGWGHMKQTWLPQSQPSGVTLGLLFREVFLILHPKIIHFPYLIILSQHPLLFFIACVPF